MHNAQYMHLTYFFCKISFFFVQAFRNFLKQAEAEVVPSSSLVEPEVEVEVVVGVEVWAWAWVKMQFSFLTFSVRWVGGRRNGD